MSFAKISCPGLMASKWALPSLSDFLNSLQILSLDELPPGNECCHICQSEYTAVSSDTSVAHQNLYHLDTLPFAQLKSLDVDEPARLPCGHIFGSLCLQEWYSSSQSSSCPICAREFFAREFSNQNREYQRRFREIQALPLRTLLTATWTEDASIYLTADVSGMISRLAHLFFKVAITSQRPQVIGTVTFPSWSFSLANDDSTNFHTFVNNYLNNFPEGQGRDQPYAKFLLEKHVAESYAKVCAALRIAAARPFYERDYDLSPAELHSELISYVDPLWLEIQKTGAETKGLKILVQLAVKAMIEHERRVGELDELCNEW